MAWVAAFTEGVMKAMLLTKLKAVGAAVLLLGLAAIGVAALSGPTGPDTAPSGPGAGPGFRDGEGRAASPAPPPRPAARWPLPTGPNKILFWRDGYLTLIDPDGTNEKRVSEDRGEFHPETATLSPDGKTLAFLVLKQPHVGRHEPERALLYARGIGEEEPGADLGVECRTFLWAPDGTALACTSLVEGPDNKPPVATHFLVDVRTKERTALALPGDHVITDWSRDGRYFLTTRLSADPKGPSARLYLMNRDGSEHKALTPANRPAEGGRLSPAVDRVLYTALTPGEKGNGKSGQRLSVLDLATGRPAAVADTPLNGTLEGYCWSPDGKRIAYAWREVHAGTFEEVKGWETWSHLVVCDPDGKNQKTIASEKGDSPWNLTIGSVDWR
jgi:hypothetical protein